MAARSPSLHKNISTPQAKPPQAFRESPGPRVAAASTANQRLVIPSTNYTYTTTTTTTNGKSNVPATTIQKAPLLSSSHIASGDHYTGRRHASNSRTIVQPDQAPNQIVVSSERWRTHQLYPANSSGLHGVQVLVPDVVPRSGRRGYSPATQIRRTSSSNSLREAIPVDSSCTVARPGKRTVLAARSITAAGQLSVAASNIEKEIPHRGGRRSRSNNNISSSTNALAYPMLAEVPEKPSTIGRRNGGPVERCTSAARTTPWNDDVTPITHNQPIHTGRRTKGVIECVRFEPGTKKFPGIPQRADRQAAYMSRRGSLYGLI